MPKRKPENQNKLTPKEAKFVEEVASGTTATQAVVNANYNPANRNAAASMGYQLMQRDRVQNALSEKISEDYQDAESDIVSGFKRYLTNEVDYEHTCVCPECKHHITVMVPTPSLKPAEFAKLVELLAKIKGHLAPTKSAKINVNADWSYPKE